ncbi:MAG: hypothetical protein DRI99_06185 [Candidatus Aminicenantes bacterium]|nr:MAG: hypothetical protein DRJ11_09110 [Candidatus Aminicenantes bacterium]RLE02320.1 MAG: hypothetical protein DRI99_06185 [Candidatus Aminicenantes bacterium]
MNPGIISKALEVWTLQNLLNLAIMLGFIAFGLALVVKYIEGIKQYLSLRVSIELWEATTVVLVDLLLVIIVIVGFLVLNPDIMADIKIAIPFVPVATILMAIALVLRLFYGGHKKSNPNYIRALWLMFVANIINIIGFSLIMEAPSGEYLEIHPSSFWTFIKTHLRSNASPHGLELAQVTFYVCFPLLLLVFFWGFVRALSQIKSSSTQKEPEN